jgi:hypothetical protein
LGLVEGVREVAGNDFLGALLLKLIGSIAGTFLALIIRMPKSRKGFQQRAIFSMIAGIILSPIVAVILRKFVDIPDDAETVVAIATVTAFVSWWAGRKVIDTIEEWKSSDE